MHTQVSKKNRLLTIISVHNFLAINIIFNNLTSVHTGATPYKCTVCDKRFTRHNILKAHQLVHTKEKPCICNIDKCGRAYAYEIDLKRHKFSAHGIYSKKHICTLCEKVFPEKKLLRKHLESHSAGNIRLPGKTSE